MSNKTRTNYPLEFKVSSAQLAVNFLKDKVGLGKMVFSEIPSTTRISPAQVSNAVDHKKGREVT
jgi:hypothetical protein